jgi:hypothetical protein|eukprot:COSAG01_NODE_3410_length_6127_cov_11.612807_4_plen_214_part_00
MLALAAALLLLATTAVPLASAHQEVGKLAPPIGGAIPFVREGVMAWNVGPPTAFWWSRSSSMMVYESARFGGPDSTYWPPSEPGHQLQPYSNHSYFRIREMSTGRVVGNVQGSECFAYGSAVVDPVREVAWVFGSERDLNGGRNRSHSAHCAPFWEGRAQAGNGVRAWWSDDLQRWNTAAHPALVFPSCKWLIMTVPRQTCILPARGRVPPVC